MRRSALVLATLVLAAAAAAPLAQARVVPPGTFLYGQRYDGWLVHWDTASIKRSMQARTSLLAVRGNRCGLDTGKVWFLPASINGLIEVNCEIPRGHHVLVPVGGVISGADKPDVLIADSNELFETLESYSLTVDGRSLRAPVVKTPIFTATSVQGSWLPLPPGTYSFRDKSRMVILSPLAPGEHTIATVADFGDGGVYGMTYHLTVR